MTLHHYTMLPTVSRDKFSEHAAPYWMRLTAHKFVRAKAPGGCAKGTNAGAKNAFSKKVRFVIDGVEVLEKDTMRLMAKEFGIGEKTLRNKIKNKTPYKGGYFSFVPRSPMPSDITER